MKTAFSAVLVVVGVLVIRSHTDPIPAQQLQQLREGMTREEVRQILGEPTKIYHEDYWQYSRFLVCGYVSVHFADGLYDGEYNYERY